MTNANEKSVLQNDVTFLYFPIGATLENQETSATGTGRVRSKVLQVDAHSPLPSGLDGSIPFFYGQRTVRARLCKISGGMDVDYIKMGK